MVAISSTLGAGSGIDTAKLIDDLVAADRSDSAKRLTARQDGVTARISALAQARSGLTAFVAATSQLVASGRLGAQAAVGDPTLLTATVTGAATASTSAAVEVRKLAKAQVLASVPIADPAAAIGQGALTFDFGTLTVAAGVPSGLSVAGSPQTVTITAANDSLFGLRDAINALGGPVAASVAHDGAGYRLVVKGATGAAHGFTIAVAETGTAGLARFGLTAADPQLTIAGEAGDAEIAIDGVTLHSAANRIEDAIPGVRLDLKREAAGAPSTVSIAVDATTALAGLGDFVRAYNELAGLVDTGTDATGRSLRDALRGLTRFQTGGLSLAALGVATNRDGTLTLKDSTASTALEARPGALQTLFGGASGLSAALTALGTRFAGDRGVLTGADTQAKRQQTGLTAETAKLDARSAALHDTLTRRFAGMDSAVAAYKATASFLTQQTDAWTSARRN